MHGDQQHMLVVGQPDQPAADQRTVFQIEGCAGFQCGEPSRVPPARRRAGAGRARCRTKAAVLRRRDPLYRLSIDENKGGAQRLMPDHDPIQRLAKGRTVQIALQPQTHGNVIGLADSLHLRQKPQPLLRKRQRQLLVPRPRE